MLRQGWWLFYDVVFAFLAWFACCVSVLGPAGFYAWHCGWVVNWGWVILLPLAGVMLGVLAFVVVSCVWSFLEGLFLRFSGAKKGA